MSYIVSNKYDIGGNTDGQNFYDKNLSPDYCYHRLWKVNVKLLR